MDSSSKSSAFNFSHLQNLPKVPSEFVWSDVTHSQGDLDVPIIDMQGFSDGKEDAKQRAAAAVRAACEEHGTFQVINHGVTSSLSQLALETATWFFGLPMDVKLKSERSPGTIPGYSVAHVERFAAKLLWNETMSFDFTTGPTPAVEDFLRSKLGQDFEVMGKVYQQYCESMNRLSQDLMELMGISLGLQDQNYYRRFFEDGYAIFRLNHYPPCKEPDRALGTGPHRDPPALTILLQDGVSGLQVFNQGLWRTVRPHPGAFVINVGDLFSALTRGKYKSCLHRAVVNKERVRQSLVFFVCPRKDKLIVPPEDLNMSSDNSDEKGAARIYPDFTWSDYHRFVMTKYRVDEFSLNNFFSWLAANPPAAE